MTKIECTSQITFTCCEICSKLTLKTPERLHDIINVQLNVYIQFKLRVR